MMTNNGRGRGVPLLRPLFGHVSLTRPRYTIITGFTLASRGYRWRAKPSFFRPVATTKTTRLAKLTTLILYNNDDLWHIFLRAVYNNIILSARITFLVVRHFFERWKHKKYVFIILRRETRGYRYIASTLVFSIFFFFFNKPSAVYCYEIITGHCL